MVKKKLKLDEDLDSVLRAIHNAVIEAQVLTERQHVRQLGHYLEPDGEPMVVPIKVPDLHPDAPEPYRQIDIPILAIAPPSSMKIDEMAVDLQLKMQGFDPEKSHVAAGETEQHSGPLQVQFTGADGSGDDSTMARVRIVFSGTEPPEAMHKIAELLGKKIV